MANVMLSNVIRRAQTKVDKDNTDLIFYVGGEHIVSENIRVHSRGIIAESTIGPMFYYGFKAGDFLLVSRNPHLKKAGLVDFDGICSEKTFVLETADSDVLLPEFLPFVLQNERFWDYAYRHRHGSTNTFINWSTLANYEFELPDLETQRKLAEVLWSINDTMDAYKKLISATDELVKSQFMEQFGDGNYPLQSIGGISDVVTKGTTPTTLGFEFVSAGVRFVKVENITATGQILKDELMHVTQECHEKLSRSQLCEGDILFSIAGVIGRTAIVPADILPANTNQALAIIRLKKGVDVLKTYLLAALSSPYVESQYNDQKKGIAQINLTLKNISDLQIPIPSLAEQERFAAFVRQSDKSKFAVLSCSNLNLWSSL